MRRIMMIAVLMLVVEWFFREKRFALDFGKIPQWIPIVSSYALIMVILEFAAHGQSFIYFQF